MLEHEKIMKLDTTWINIVYNNMCIKYKYLNIFLLFLVCAFGRHCGFYSILLQLLHIQFSNAATLL